MFWITGCGRALGFEEKHTTSNAFSCNAQFRAHSVKNQVLSIYKPLQIIPFLVTGFVIHGATSKLNCSIVSGAASRRDPYLASSWLRKR